MPGPKQMKNSIATNGEHCTLFSEYDISLFKAGKHYRLYEKLGAHAIVHNGAAGYYFAVWAPNARQVNVTGDFNSWSREANQMQVRWDGSGIWELFIPGIAAGQRYKYHIVALNGYEADKGDPYAGYWEVPPRTASITSASGYRWKDRKWMRQRAGVPALSKPMSVYEVHAGSWKRKQDNQLMTWLELAGELPAYCLEMGFTHVELMPVMEHPFYGSWGYQVTGYFAPGSRYGTPDDFMALVDAFHQAGIGVLLDWVPSHFPADEHGPGYFDGTHLYEHEDPRKGFHPDWQSFIFNYSRNEVRAFLISNALYWLDVFHIDGLRVDAVASMLYLDYSRKAGEWEPNSMGGRENLDAVSFLQEFNQAVHAHYPDVVTIAEESTAWPGVTAPVNAGGLGFDLKWMMGWMHDTLSYFSNDPVYRGYHQGQLAFSIYYAFSERFMLPLSHDEVVYGKRSMINKMPGDEWQRFANLRLLYSYMFGHPGAKLLFMGAEFAQQHEWRHDYSLDWHELGHAGQQGLQALVKDLNRLYAGEPALYALAYSPEGFEWIDFQDAYNSVLCWIRKDANGGQLILVANFTPVVHHNYRVGVPIMGNYIEYFNSDLAAYHGSGVSNIDLLETAPIARHGHQHSLSLVLPPLAMIVLKRTGDSFEF